MLHQDEMILFERIKVLLLGVVARYGKEVYHRFLAQLWHHIPCTPTDYNMLAPPGGFARAGTRSSVTTCDVYPQPFVVLVVMVFIFTVFFQIKCVFFRSRLHTMFSDAIDHWMFWPCPNVIFFRQIWRTNLQSPVIYSVSIWHDLPCMLFGGVWLGASCCGSVEYLCHHFFRAGSSCLFLF